LTAEHLAVPRLHSQALPAGLAILVSVARRVQVRVLGCPMEGRASNFKKVLADFESRLHGAEFVAIDTELTGVDISGDPDSFEESAQMRIEKNCRIAERYTLIQLGLTVVSRSEANEGHLTFASYNLFAFPYLGPELLGNEPGFFCQASALQFNAQHRVDFNKWIRDGIPYMNREDEKRYLANENGSTNKKTGLLNLWKVLCQSRLPFVVHTCMDLFFLLAAFERRPLPRNDPKALAMMIRQCTPKVYDTAHLHTVFGHFKRLSLIRFFEDAKARYDEVKDNNRTTLDRVPQLDFHFQGETNARYGKKLDDLAHEAGFDSFITAQLFAYLRAIAPNRVKEGANRLFLYRSVEFLDLDRAVTAGQIPSNIYDLSRVTLLVAELEDDASVAPNLVAAAGADYKWMDGTHLLVVLRASGGAAVRKAAELAAIVHGVISWMSFDDWRAAELACADKSARSQLSDRARAEEELGVREACGNASEASADWAPSVTGLCSSSSSSCCDDGGGDENGGEGSSDKDWSATALVSAGAISAACGSLLLLFVIRGTLHLTAAGARVLDRWRRI